MFYSFFRRSAATAPMATSSPPARPTWPSTGTPKGPTWRCCRWRRREDSTRWVHLGTFILDIVKNPKDFLSNFLRICQLYFLTFLHQAHVPLIHAHSEFVTDFAFSPFDDGLLATGSQDLSVSFGLSLDFRFSYRLVGLCYNQCTFKT